MGRHAWRAFVQKRRTKRRGRTGAESAIESGLGGSGRDCCLCFKRPGFHLTLARGNDRTRSSELHPGDDDLVCSGQPAADDTQTVDQGAWLHLLGDDLVGDDREFGKNRTLSFASSCNQFIVFSMDERKWRKLFDKQIGIL